MKGDDPFRLWQELLSQFDILSRTACFRLEHLIIDVIADATGDCRLSLRYVFYVRVWYPVNGYRQVCLRLISLNIRIRNIYLASIDQGIDNVNAYIKRTTDYAYYSESSQNIMSRGNNNKEIVYIKIPVYSFVVTLNIEKQNFGLF